MCRELQGRLVGLERRVAAAEVAVTIPYFSSGDAGGGRGGGGDAGAAAAAAVAGGVTVGEAVQANGQVYFVS